MCGQPEVIGIRLRAASSPISREQPALSAAGMAAAPPSLRSTMFSEIQLVQSAPAAGTIQRQINHCCARTASNDCSF
jgi:hypothetical protein